MPYRNFSRLALAVLSLLSGVAALVTGLVFVAVHHNAYGENVPVSPWAAAVGALFFLAFVITGTGWLVLRGINYDTWYRQAHPGEPLHRPSTDDVSGAADWRAADRTPGF